MQRADGGFRAELAFIIKCDIREKETERTKKRYFIAHIFIQRHINDKQVG